MTWERWVAWAHTHTLESGMMARTLRSVPRNVATQGSDGFKRQICCLFSPCADFTLSKHLKVDFKLLNSTATTFKTFQQLLKT